MLIEILLIGITALLFRPLKRTASNCLDVFNDKASLNKFQNILSIVASVLTAIAGLSWVMTILYLLIALLRSISPGPEPYVLLPWFIGIVATSIPWFFADSLFGLIRKDD